MTVAVDKWYDAAKSLSGPYTDSFTVTPSDTVDLPYVTRGLQLDADGSVTFITLDGTTVTRPLAGLAIYPIRATRVLASGTSAVNIYGWL